MQMFTMTERDAIVWHEVIGFQLICDLKVGRWKICSNEFDSNSILRVMFEPNHGPEGEVQDTKIQDWRAIGSWTKFSRSQLEGIPDHIGKGARVFIGPTNHEEFTTTTLRTNSATRWDLSC